jgi:hypothetical protein
MFLRVCSPRSVNSTATLPLTWSQAEDEMVGYTLKPCRNIDTIAENVIAFDQDVAEVDPDPVQHTPFLWDALIAFGHRSLHSHRTLDGIDHRGKLKQHAVPRGLHEATGECGRYRPRRGP